VAAHVDSCATCRADARAFAETARTIAETQGRDALPSCPRGLRHRVSNTGMRGSLVGERQRSVPDPRSADGPPGGWGGRGDTVAVTPEPPGGVEAPSGSPVLAGTSYTRA